MKNKKALMMKTLITLIITALCIIVLVYLGIAVLSGFLNPKVDREKAERTLNQLAEKIETLEDNETDRFIVLAPKGWVIMTGGRIIAICSFNEISRIMYGQTEDLQESYFGNCSRTGIQKTLSYNLKMNSVCGETRQLEDCLMLESLPIEIILKREKNTVFLETEVNVKTQTLKENLLNYRVDESSKILKELISETIALLKKGESPHTYRKEIGELLEKHFENLNTIEMFELDHSFVSWKFIIKKKGELGSELFLERRDYVSREPLVEKTLYEDETYKVTITYHKGEYDYTSGGML